MKREQLPIPGTAERTLSINPCNEVLASRSFPLVPPSMGPAYRSDDQRVTLYHGDCLDILGRLPPESVDVVFADPPYFLSGGGSTCKGGQRVSVNKGSWDAPSTVAGMHAFNRAWLMAARRVLKPNGSLWACGTSHNIYSVGYAMQELGFKMLNEVVWEKPNPPPNLSCRYFTHATETLLWVARDRKSKHHFAYADMRAENGGKQMKTVWRFAPPPAAEVTHGRYPTQKPTSLVFRALRASCPPGGTVLDCFMGSGTSGVVARALGCRYIGIDQSTAAVELAQARIMGTAEGEPVADEAVAPPIREALMELLTDYGLTSEDLPTSDLVTLADFVGHLESLRAMG